IRLSLLSRCLQSRFLAAVDKSQVFALKLSGDGFAKKSLRLIRRKFFIDIKYGRFSSAIHDFETISDDLRKPAVHHLR
ncbi:MAG: hypothetical protein KGJ00_17830, partial [Bradyrhizobium sp.]|nr:hypothetical protein [Bradyrhizobium sp.]